MRSQIIDLVVIILVVFLIVAIVMNRSRCKKSNCVTDEDCPANQICDNGLCIEPVITGCLSDNDCLINEVCIDDICVPFPARVRVVADESSYVSFGISVAIDGNTAVIGSPGNSVTAIGAAYVFVREGLTWVQQAKLMASDNEPGDLFGISVAISGDTIVVAALDVDGNEVATGAAYVFVRNGTTWSEQQKIFASDGSTGDALISADIDGDTVVLGTRYTDFTGAAYVFTRSGVLWTEQQKLVGSDAVPGDFFGTPVAINGNTIVVGAAFQGAGAAYVFVFNGASWVEQQKLTATDGSFGDGFGRAVAINRDIAIIGAPVADGNEPETGAVYIFTRNGGIWTESEKLLDTTSVSGNYFGYDVAFDGVSKLIGEPLADGGLGAAYFLT